MSIVTDRMNANRPPPTADMKKSQTLNNNKDLDVDARKEEPSFFGSFFNKTQTQQKKKGVQAIMEAVSWFWLT